MSSDASHNECLKNAAIVIGEPQHIARTPVCGIHLSSKIFLGAQ